LLKGTPFGPARMIPSLPFGGAQVNVWAAISSTGFLAYEFYDGALDGDAYVKILKHKLLPAARKHFGSHNNWEFQEDNAPWHTVDEVYDLLEAKGIDDTHHPCVSPDLSPIENVWPCMAARVSAKEPRNKKELKKAISAVISEMNTEEPTTLYFKHLYSSMSGRVHEVLLSHGFPIAH
jgi:transposase